MKPFMDHSGYRLDQHYCVCRHFAPGSIALPTLSLGADHLWKSTKAFLSDRCLVWPLAEPNRTFLQHSPQHTHAKRPPPANKAFSEGQFAHRASIWYYGTQTEHKMEREPEWIYNTTYTLYDIHIIHIHRYSTYRHSLHTNNSDLDIHIIIHTLYDIHIHVYVAHMNL